MNNAQELTMKVGAAVDHLVSLVEDTERDTDNDDLANALTRVGQSINDIYPDFNVDTYLIGGLSAAAKVTFAL